MVIEVKLGEENGEVSENIYGQFIEHALDCIEGGIYDPQSEFADKNGIRRDVVELVQGLSPSVIRFPGGTMICQYHWEDAVGPKEGRIWRKNLIWGGELDPGFGTAEFVDLCRKVGAEPMLCVNMVSGTAEEAGNWVEYCNGTGNSYYAQLRRQHGHEEPFDVKYWCIGNESYSEPDMGIHHDVKLYIRDAMEFIKRMKLTDGSIKTVVVGCDQKQWNEAVLEALHTVTDYFSLHYYASAKEGRFYEPFEGEKKLQEIIDGITESISAYPDQVSGFNPWYRFPPRQDKIKIAVDEWNIWDFENNEVYGLKPVYCWRDALWSASMLNLFIKTPEIGMANMAQMVNVLAPIMADQESAWMQATAYPFMYYTKYMTGKRILLGYSSPLIEGTKGVQALSIAAVRKGDRTCVAVVNRDLEQRYDVRFSRVGAGTAKIQKITVLTGNAPDAVCSKDQNCMNERCIQNAGENIEIPAGSICLIMIGE